MVRRGEVWLAALDPTVGSEIQKTQPCVIVPLRTAIVAPMTTGTRPAPFSVPVRFRRKDGLILPDQMRAIDRDRPVARLGRITAATLRAVLEVLGEIIAA